MVKAPREVEAIFVAGAKEITDILHKYFADSLAGPHAVVHDSVGYFQSYAKVAAENADVAMATELDGGGPEIVWERGEPKGVAVDA